MIRATTPLQEFVFTVNPETFSKILITYSQEETIILEKTEEDLTITEDASGTRWTASFRMTQQEANLFDEGAARVQVRVLTQGNEALASDITTVKVSEVLDDEVLT